MTAHVRIEQIIEHSANERTFVFDKSFGIKAGQFAMVWLPGIDEKPFSYSGKNSITVKKLGPFTEQLFKKKEGDYIDIRGPYGNSFPEKSQTTAIAGGCGIAPLRQLILDGYVKNLVMACKTRDSLLFLDEFEELYKKGTIKNLITLTEDGSFGKKGIATDVAIPEAELYVLCGPERMMQAVAEKINAPEKIYLSLERYMKCAVGLCGTCSFSGYRVCVDGPVFSYEQIQDMPHFAKLKRIKSGELVKF